MRSPTEQELSRLFERSPIGMYRSTESGRFVYANAALARLLGHASPADLRELNLTTDVYADPAERARLIAEYRTRSAPGADSPRPIRPIRARWRTRDGRPLVVQLYGAAVTGEDGEECFDVSVVDVTAAEAASDRLRGQREELERTARTLDLVVRQVSAMFWLVDRELRVVLGGGVGEEVLGYSSDRWIGHSLREVVEHGGGDAEALGAHARALEGEVVTYRSTFRGKQLAVTVAPDRHGDRIAGVIGTAIDVTALHALEAKMLEAQRAESLGVLAGGLAHDFNNLLVAILGNADLGLRDIPRGAPGREALENVRHASLRAAELTDQLLAYAGRRGVGVQRVDIAAAVDELLRISAATLPANIATEVAIPAELAIRGDAAQIRQVLLNLFANARDALTPGGGTIAISASPVHHRGFPDRADVLTATAGDYVELELADTGPGIDPELRRRIFDPFFTTKPTGHGLGLAAVLGIVRAHGGGLRVHSAPGAGARFCVLWPAGAAPREQAAPPQQQGKTVLVIDDEPLVRDVVARMVEDLGYAAVTAADGPSGLELIDRQPVDVALVDLTMPRMSGAQVVAALRARRPGLPVVVCSGFDRDRHGAVAADAYLAKPFRLEALEEALAKVLAGPATGPGSDRS